MDRCNLATTISNLKEQLRVMEELVSSNRISSTNDDRLDDDQFDDGDDYAAEDHIPLPIKVSTLKKACTLRSLPTWSPAIRKKRNSSKQDDKDWQEETNRKTKSARTTTRSYSSNSSSTGSEEDDDVSVIPKAQSRNTDIRRKQTIDETKRRMVHAKHKFSTPTSSANQYADLPNQSSAILLKKGRSDPKDIADNTVTTSDQNTAKSIKKIISNTKKKSDKDKE